MKSYIFFSLAGLVATETLYSSYTFDPLKHLSGIAPYFEPSDPPRNPAPPRGCTVQKAAYLVRHAAINANDFDYEEYLQPFIEKFQNKSSSIDFTSIPELYFLHDWIAPQLTEQEQLTRTGMLEAAQLGVSISYRYQNLQLPTKIWASTAERTVKSAQGLIFGLETSDNQIELVQIYEGKESGANSLTPYSSCPAYHSSTGSDQESEYLDKYTAPIKSRFNALAPSFNFSTSDIFAMQEMCGYETVIRGSSPFCSLDLFGPDEWLSFEYANDILYHYNTGYGNPTSGVIGFPWMNETFSLLASTSATPGTSNTTIANSGSSSSNTTSSDDQDIYISFTHRELPPTVLVAMGLFNNTQFTSESYINDTMPTDQTNPHRAWISSYILPFLTNIAIEKMMCNDTSGSSAGTYYRVLVNQSPQTLPGCFDGPSESCSEDGLHMYLDERAALFSGFSERCGTSEKYDNSTDFVTFYTGDNGGNSGNGTDSGAFRKKYRNLFL